MSQRSGGDGDGGGGEYSELEVGALSSGIQRWWEGRREGRRVPTAKESFLAVEMDLSYAIVER